MTGEFLHALLSGCKVTFYDDGFNPKRLLSVMKQRKCTVMCGTPTMLYNLSVFRKQQDEISINKIVVSGESLLPQIADRLLECFPGVDFYNVFGLTEASPRVAYLEPALFQSKQGSVGLPLKSVTVNICSEDGSTAETGQIGELMVAGPNVMLEYWRDKQLTHSKLVNGYLRTGDLAYKDEDGFLFIVGRMDQMIIRGGMNIYPQEIENALLECAEIKEIAAWGRSNPKYGQQVCIACVPQVKGQLNNGDILAICRKKLEPYQWPDEIAIVDHLPRNASGKLLRKELYSAMCDLEDRHEKLH
jgi:long-chain acyl-CoA synthetase